MKSYNRPLVFWDYCSERRPIIKNLTAKNLFQLEGQTPHFTVTGEEGEISNLCQFGWYQWCYFREQNSNFPLGREILGRVLGPSKGEGNEIAQCVLKANGNIVPRHTTRPINTLELSSESEKRKRNVFDELITAR